MTTIETTSFSGTQTYTGIEPVAYLK